MVSDSLDDGDNWDFMIQEASTRNPLRRTIRWIGFGMVAAASVYVGHCFYNRQYVHIHCIKQSHLCLLVYAESNEGRYPESEKGFGDALLKLSDLDDTTFWIPFFTNARDQGDYFREALESGGDIDESQCSRTYVQGLHEGSNPGIAILFDTDAVKGGDHLYNIPGQPKLREVMSVDGSMSKIKEDGWTSFVEQQRELLKKEGFSEDAINEAYGPPR